MLQMYVLVPLASLWLVWLHFVAPCGVCPLWPVMVLWVDFYDDDNDLWFMLCCGLLLIHVGVEYGCRLASVCALKLGFVDLALMMDGYDGVSNGSPYSKFDLQI